jgi:hypothetical protein
MAVPLHPAHESMLNFLVEKTTPEEILAFQVSEAEQERTSELLDKQNEGTLTQEEAAELEAIRQMDLFYMALRAKALQALRRNA